LARAQRFAIFSPPPISKRETKMSAATSPLPAGWVHILDEMHVRLDHAIALADARLQQAPHFDADSLAVTHTQEIAKWSERLHRLHTYLESAEQVVQGVDEVLQREEAEIRQRIARSATLRQKLAKMPGRAIG